MAFPPLSVGAVHVKSTEVFPWLAAKFVGASGIVLGVADTKADGLDKPFILFAETVNV